MSRASNLLSGLALATATLLAATAAAPPVEAASLTPTRPALLKQGEQARAHGYTYLENEAQVREFVRKGYLVRLRGNDNYVLKHTVRPYARPEVKLFIERLSAQYEAACGKNLVVTSLVRPKNRQPSNSSPLSVHPTGMAMDLRVSKYPECRRWLERALLNLEARGVLEAARERRPPHYHVVLFPRPYARYVERKTGRAVSTAKPDPKPAAVRASSGATYRVRRGDNLTTIARRHGTSVAALKRTNGLRSSLVRAGQRLRIPGATYRVRSGDNLWTIARRHGTSVAALKRTNDLRSSRLRPGQVLRIPS